MIGLNDELPSAPAQPSRLPGLVAAAFRADGWLQERLGLEHRPAQEHMARAVATALAEDSPLLFEAGTGVGKSLAYLVPGIIHATDARRPLVVSTHTISLQDQIEAQDLPLCRRLFAAEPALAFYAGFKSAVLVGKSNYLCTTRLARALDDRASLFAEDDYAELQRIAAWAETTASGLRQDLSPAPRPDVWDAVNADSSACSRKYCDCEQCFYQRARGRLRSAQVIIVNHALLFSLIRAGGAPAPGSANDAKGVLFPDDCVVLDEAHTVPEVATAHFGLSLGSHGMERALKHLYNPRTKRGLLVKFRGAKAGPFVDAVLSEVRLLFAEIDATLLAARPIARLREPLAPRPSLDAALAALQRLVAGMADQLNDGRERDELLEERERLQAFQASINEWLLLADGEHVYWAERGGRQQTTVILRSAPIDVAPSLRRSLFGCNTSVIATSATLAVAGEMAPFVARMGAEGARSAIAPSPFDYERQMRVFVAADMPLPSADQSRLALDSLADYIAFCTQRVRGGSLVLFTSHSDLRATAAALEPAYRAANRPLLLQGEAASRTELAQRMRALGNAVLFGTDSFWTGVDVPGDALAQVIITRLPFDPPTHPISEAQAGRIRDQGGNPFNELTLPDALIKFRQGIGRLIRKESDRGLVTILDARVLAKTYGRIFMECLPKREFTLLTRENREEEFRPFQ